jgi:hypothetical protein
VPHRAHVPPPQSTSVSAPFFTPSVQVAAAHWWLVHTPLGQSDATVHWPGFLQNAPTL